MLKMHVSWSWISSVCRQKRILILLCTFGTSFIAFNYSLLSSSTSTTTSPVVNSLATNKIGEDDRFILNSHKNYKGELNHDYEKWKDKSTLPVEVALSKKLSRKFDGTVLKKESLPLSSSVSHHYSEKASTLINFNTYFPKSPSGKSSETPKLSTTKHAQTSFKRIHNHESKSNTRWKNESHLNHHHQNIRVNDSSSHNNNVKFITSAIEEKSENNTITSSVVIGKKTKNNKIPPRKTDDQVEKPDVITLSSVENVEKSITRVLRTDFPVESNSIGSSLVAMQPTSPEVPLELNFSSSSQPEQIASLFHASSDMDMDSGTNNSNHPFPPPPPLSSPISPKSNLLSPTPPPPPPPQRSFRIPPCNTTFQLHRIQKRKKNLTVIENFIMGWMPVKCNETITYTTHGDYRYLDNLVPLVDRWNGPVSLSIYCPGEDLEETLKLISYFKQCASSNVNKWVTFHLIYDSKYSKRPAGMSGDIPWLDTLYQQGKWKDCSQKPTFSKGNTTFRIQTGLLYPINIARNVARAAAQTHFVLASDIELYPSINLIPSFMEMIGRLQKKEEENQRINYYTKRSRFTAAAAAVVAKIFFPGAAAVAEDEESSLTAAVTSTEQNEVQQQRDQQSNSLSSDLYHNRPSQRSRHVFVLPVFEVKKDIVPCQCETKEQLVSLLKYRAAVIFHHSICPQCHTFPKYEEWKVLYPGSDGGQPLRDYRKYNCSSGNGTNYANSTFQPASQQTEMMRIFHKAKRKFPYQLWEPIFIGTKDEPIYDERLSWEGLRDKMVSGYVMCTLDYDFYILDNAFLVHKPGIRRVNHLVTRTVMSQDRLINFRIRSELLKKFGKHDECAL